jgi:outer membrane protein assembly factor BamD (BamD/ComL family)
MKSALLFGSLIFCLCFTLAISSELVSEIDFKNAEIKSSIDKAKSDNTLWRDTVKLYQSAQDLIMKKDYVQANKLLDDVLHQLNAAHQQAAQQSSQSVIPSYLKN